MKKFFCAVTALSVVLSGCSSFERISATEKNASDEITRAERIAGELRKQRAVVRETNQQWINTTPLPEKNRYPGNTGLPGRHKHPGSHHTSPDCTADF
ncbi:putative type IV pilus outer membrane secretin lipoprotein [Escherichia coli]|nr:putative type IV pilus outer membrane secretin lipoprotein [Escherichia coli]